MKERRKKGSPNTSSVLFTVQYLSLVVGNFTVLGLTFRVNRTDIW